MGDEQTYDIYVPLSPDELTEVIKSLEVRADIINETMHKTESMTDKMVVLSERNSILRLVDRLQRYLRKP